MKAWITPCFVAILLLIGGINVSHSEEQRGAYIGLEVGRSYAQLPGSSDQCEACIVHDLHTHSNVGNVFGGYRYNWIAGEVGAGDLSHYDSHNVGPLPSGVMRDIHQQIDTKQRYARMLFYGPGRYRLEPFMSLGYSRVTMKNHEWGYNDPSMRFVEQVNYDKRTKPFYGAGLQYAISDSAKLRSEVTYIKHVAVSRWTQEQNVTVVWVGVLVSFQ